MHTNHWKRLMSWVLVWVGGIGVLFGPPWVSVEAAEPTMGQSSTVPKEETKSPSPTREPSPAFVAGPDETFDGLIAGDFEDRLMIRQGQLVTIDRGTKDGLLPKTRYAVYRLQKYLQHPLTGVDLGRMVTQVGLIEVTSEIRTATAVAKVLRSKDPLRRGDLLRLIPAAAPQTAPR